MGINSRRTAGSATTGLVRHWVPTQILTTIHQRPLFSLAETRTQQAYGQMTWHYVVCGLYRPSLIRDMDLSLWRTVWFALIPSTSADPAREDRKTHRILALHAVCREMQARPPRKPCVQRGLSNCVQMAAASPHHGPHASKRTLSAAFVWPKGERRAATHVCMRALTRVAGAALTPSMSLMPLSYSSVALRERGSS